MELTKVTIRPIAKPKNKVLAYVELQFDDLLISRDWKIVNGAKGLWLAAPNKPSGRDDGKFYDRVYINKSWVDGTPGQEFKNKLQATVLKKYEEMGGELSSPVFEDQGVTDRNQSDSNYKDPGIQDDNVPF